MATLYRNREVSARELREGLDLTAGNLASHAQRLADSGLIEPRRALVGRSFEARYRITPAGLDAFRRYLAVLQRWVETFGLQPPKGRTDHDATRPPDP